MLDNNTLRLYLNTNRLLRFPNSKIIWKNRKGFAAELKVRDGKYIILLEYNIYKHPNVYVVEPQIDMSNPLEIHTFGLKYNSTYKKELPLLCLTYNETDQWNINVSLIESFIPWAIEWTEFYELWLLTGIWYGKGIHPSSIQKKCDELVPTNENKENEK